jgi:hypothetical protein
LTEFSSLPKMIAYSTCGRLAQLGERYPYKVDVGGSIPSTPTIQTTCLEILRKLDWLLKSS